MTETLSQRRTRLLGPNMATFYNDPVHIVRGEGVWLWDADGRKFLDCYNNVPHVGHCHPKVVEAITKQASTLNTHTRYLHDGIVNYAERLTATFSGELDTVVMVCTGSEANDIALRMAQAVTGKTGVIATDNTYHGNTTAVSQLSTKKPPIGGHAPNIRRVPSPDSVAPLGGTKEGQAQVFANNVGQAIADLEASGHGFASLILCPFFANEGFPDLEPGFLEPVAKLVRDAGGILIADEVQPGFGRVGSHFWGHEKIGVQPDVVTIGKPMANGHPAAAVVAKTDITSAFREAFGYFNTFGGNPVSCAAAMAVMDVLEDEDLVSNAAQTGAYALKKMDAIRHPMIAETRGAGLFFGMEFIDQRGDPAPEFTALVVEAMKAKGILLNRLGRHYNCLKIRPPMPFSKDNADLLIDCLQEVLHELPA